MVRPTLAFPCLDNSEKNISVSEDVEKLEHLYTVDRNAKWCTPMENSMEIPQKLENRTRM